LQEDIFIFSRLINATNFPVLFSILRIDTEQVITKRVTTDDRRPAKPDNVLQRPILGTTQSVQDMLAGKVNIAAGQQKSEETESLTPKVTFESKLNEGHNINVNSENRNRKTNTGRFNPVSSAKYNKKNDNSSMYRKPLRIPNKNEIYKDEFSRIYVHPTFHLRPGVDYKLIRYDYSKRDIKYDDLPDIDKKAIDNAKLKDLKITTDNVELRRRGS